MKNITSSSTCSSGLLQLQNNLDDEDCSGVVGGSSGSVVDVKHKVVKASCAVSKILYTEKKRLVMPNDLSFGANDFALDYCPTVEVVRKTVRRLSFGHEK